MRCFKVLSLDKNFDLKHKLIIDAFKYNYTEVRANGNPFQYSCLDNPMDRGAWRAADRRAAQGRHD